MKKLLLMMVLSGVAVQGLPAAQTRGNKRSVDTLSGDVVSASRRQAVGGGAVVSVSDFQTRLNRLFFPLLNKQVQTGEQFVQWYATMTPQEQELLIQGAAEYDDTTMTALQLAAMQGYAEIVQELLKIMPEEMLWFVDAKNQATALHFAAFGGCFGIVESIVKAVAEESQAGFVLLPDKYGKTALDLARLKKHEAVVCFLARVASIAEEIGTMQQGVVPDSGDGEAPALHSVPSPLAILATVVCSARGVRVDESGVGGAVGIRTVDKGVSNRFSQAVMLGDVEDLVVLLRDMTLEDKKRLFEADHGFHNGRSALHVVVSSRCYKNAGGNQCIVQCLLEAIGDEDFLGTWIQKPDKCGNTLFHSVCSQKNKDIFIDLLAKVPASRKDAVIFLANSDGDTALHRFIRSAPSSGWIYDLLDAVSTPILRSKLLSTYNKAGQSALHALVKINNAASILETLLNKYVIKDDIKDLLRQQDEDGQNVLHAAVSEASRKVRTKEHQKRKEATMKNFIQRVLAPFSSVASSDECFAFIQMRSTTGESALEMAEKAGLKEIVDVFREFLFDAVVAREVPAADCGDGGNFVGAAAGDLDFDTQPDAELDEQADDVE